MTTPSEALDPRVVPSQAWQLSPQTSSQEAIYLVREAPLRVTTQERLAAVMMRTPGMDVELVVGYLVGEGWVASYDQIDAVLLQPALACGASMDLADVRLTAEARPLAIDERPHLVRAVAGDASRHGEWPLPAVGSEVQAALGALAAAGTDLRAGQTLRQLAGGVHAFGLYRADGERLVVCEDIGRHNAMDKAVGWCLARGLNDAWAFGLCSGRLSYEMVAKAARVQLPILASFSAPSSLGVETAERCGITLVGYLKDGEARVYSQPQRVQP